MSCGVLWHGDTRIRMLAAAQELKSCVALVTVTAPGVDVLPWDKSGERVEESAAAAWNATAPARWSELHRKASRVRRWREHERAAGWCLLMKVWEYQRRGALHLHLVVPAGTPAGLACSNAYTRELAALAGAAGFGFVDRGELGPSGGRRSTRTLKPVAPGRAACYVASYVASSGAGKAGIAEVARKQGVPGAVAYVSQRLTARSGVTMRSLRDRRRVASRWPEAAADEASWHAACVLDAMERGHPPLLPGARGALLRVALALRWTATVDVATGEVRAPTRAPAPGQPAGGHSKVARATAVGKVRLDSVLHRVAIDAQLLVWTRVTVEPGLAFAGAQGQQ